MNEAKIRIEYMALSQIARAPRNPKDHDVDAVGESIRRFGFVAPIVLDENTGRLVAGHGRLETLQRAKAAGEAPPERIIEKDDDWLVPVVRGVAFADDQEAEAYLVADNRLVELGGWTERELAEILQDHASSERGLTAMGYDQNDLDEILTRIAAADIPTDLQEPPAQIDKAAELQKRWETEHGQLWEVGPHRVLCGDCRNQAEIALLWHNAPKFRMIWTDPPYGVDYAGKNEYLNRGDRGNRIQKEIENDRLSADESPSAFCRRTNPSAGLGRTRRGLLRDSALWPIASTLHRRILRGRVRFPPSPRVWAKQQFVIGMSDYHHQHETILYGWRPDGPHYFVKDRTQSTIFEVDKPHVSDLHPTTKPVELIARMIRNSSRPDEIVYDPFLGSGSTILAADQLDRVGYGVEIDPGYVAVALERLFQLTGIPPKLFIPD
jgi:hypothetical protein